MDSSFSENETLDKVGWNWDNSYARLPEFFYKRVRPSVFPDPQLAIINFSLAEQLGLDLTILNRSQAAGLFAGQLLPTGTDPLAQGYAGHQFGGFTILGDGRAILLGEHVTPAGERFDIQFKGSGQTPFSRRGDGKAAFGPMLREYLISEAMFGLGIPTSRSLAVVTTGEPVYRERVLPGSVLTRVAASHIRVGTFQFALAQQNPENLKSLADHTIARHYPDLIDSSNRYFDFLQAAIDRQAALIARWQMVGFIHGVMNTDNMLLSGETIDYGPCAFMDTYHPQTVFSSIDHQGRYAYGNQPTIGQWNLARFAETLLDLIDADKDQAVEMATSLIHQYKTMFDRYWLQGMRAKLGLLTEEEHDRELVQPLLDWMARMGADFTNTFRYLTDQGPTLLSENGEDGRALTERTSPLSQPLPSEPFPKESANEGIYRDPTFQRWLGNWNERLLRNGEPLAASLQLMRQHNPYVIPRNYFVEEALNAAQDEGDLTKFHRLLDVLKVPFSPSKSGESYRFPPSCSGDYQTFCGT